VTPIKSIILYGVMVLVRDQADNISLKATAPSERDAEWMADSLARYHQVRLERVEDRGSRIATHSLLVEVAQ
jgi:hypothetical protein